MVARRHDPTDPRAALEPPPPPSLERLLELCRRHAEAARSALLGGKQASLCPMLLVVSRRPGSEDDIAELICVAGGFNTEEEKVDVMRLAGRRAYEARTVPVAAVLASEAWVAAQKVGEPRCQPKDHPQRREVVVVAGTVLGHRHNAVGRMPVTRNGRGGIVLGALDGFQTAGVTLPLLQEVWRGFFAPVGATKGVDAASAWAHR